MVDIGELYNHLLQRGENSMYFRLGYFVDRLFLPEKNSKLEFDYGGSQNIVVNLEPISPEISERNPQIKGSSCNAKGSYNPSDKIKKIFDSLQENKFPGDENISELIQKNEENALPLGILKEYEELYQKVENIPLSYFPEPFQSYVRQVHTELYNYIMRTIDVFRWRYSKYGKHNPLLNGAMAWSYDGTSWKIVPQNIQMNFSGFAEPPIPQDASQEVSKIVKEGFTEPVGHELYREARFLSSNNPRSSVVVAIAAIEVGIKECIGALVPNSQWLVSNIASPPIVRILTEYLPQLPAKNKIKGEVLPPPRQIIDILKKGVSIRNNITHKGGPAPKHHTIEEIFSAVKDTLWLLDFYSGHQWAFKYISREVREKLTK